MGGGRSLSASPRNRHPPPAAAAAGPSTGSLDLEARAKRSGRPAHQQEAAGIEAAGPHSEEDTGRQGPVDHMVAAELEPALAEDIAPVAEPWPGPDIPVGRPVFRFRRTPPLDRSNVVGPFEDLHRLPLRLSYDIPAAIPFAWLLVLEIYPEPPRASAERVAIPELPLAAAPPIPLRVDELRPAHRLFVAHPGLQGLDSIRIALRPSLAAAQQGLAADTRHIVQPAVDNSPAAGIAPAAHRAAAAADIASAAVHRFAVAVGTAPVAHNIAADNPGETADSSSVAETAPRPVGSLSGVSSFWRSFEHDASQRPVVDKPVAAQGPLDNSGRLEPPDILKDCNTYWIELPEAQWLRSKKNSPDSSLLQGQTPRNCR